jgi:hypothetical protein
MIYDRASDPAASVGGGDKHAGHFTLPVVDTLYRTSTYYNEVRTHVSLGKDAPCRRPVERFGDIVAYPVLGGLHHRYARI